MQGTLKGVPIHYQNVRSIRSELDRGYTAWARDAIHGEIIESTACFNRFSEIKLNLPSVEIAHFSDVNIIGRYLQPNTIILSPNLLKHYLTLRGTFGPNDGGFGLTVSEIIAHENLHRFRKLNNLDQKMSTYSGKLLSWQVQEYSAVLGSLSYIVMYGYGNYLEEVKETANVFNNLYPPSTRTTIYAAAYDLSLSKCLRKGFDPEHELSIILRSDTINVLQDIVSYMENAEIETWINKALRKEFGPLRK